MSDAEIIPFEPRRTPEQEPPLPMSRCRFADLLARGLITVDFSDEVIDGAAFPGELPQMPTDDDYRG